MCYFIEYLWKKGLIRCLKLQTGLINIILSYEKRKRHTCRPDWKVRMLCRIYPAYNFARLRQNWRTLPFDVAVSNWRGVNRSPHKSLA